MLDKQNIKGNKKIGKDELTALFKKKPNRKILGTRPYLLSYYIGKSKLDTAKLQKKREETIQKYGQKIAAVDTSSSNKKRNKNLKKIERLREKRDKKVDKIDVKLREGNWLMRVVGEPPSLFDTTNTNYNVRQMKFYLNSKGYFLNDIESKVDTNGRYVTETYTIEEGEPYKIRQIAYLIPDTVVDRLVKENMKETKLQAGKNYEEGNFSEERDRINRLLKENGYYDFSTQYIVVEIDSSVGTREMDVRVVVRNPANKNSHPRYTIDKIIFNSDVTRARQEKWDTTNFEGIHYIYKKDNFSKRILNKKIRVKPGDFYTQSKIYLTQRQLAALDMYRFININFDKIEPDSLADTVRYKLIANIRTSPLQKFQTTEEGGVNVSSIGFVPGPFGSFSFKSRNTFRGFEIFETTLRASVMGQAGISDPNIPYRTEEYDATLSLSFPQFFFPTGLRFKMEDYAPKTRFTAGYSLVNRPEYRRGNIKTSMNYLFNPSPTTQWNISILDLNFISSDIKDNSEGREFDRYLKNISARGNPLINTFRNSVVSDMNATYTYNSNLSGGNIKSKFYKFYVESGGTLLNLYEKIPSLRNKLNDSNITIYNIPLQTYKYFKVNTDVRYYFPVKKNTFAMRFNVGFARPYGSNNPVLPYEKFFFMGGTNSMRGWQVRRLGPGTYKDTVNPYRFEQPGEIMLEMNYEYRFKIISFLEGAVFSDIGNLWTFRNDPTRPGSQFKINRFYEQLAVATGVGMRLNFTFLILRLDLGVKTIDPSAEGSNFVLTNQRLRDYRLNIGIGYPF